MARVAEAPNSRTRTVGLRTWRVDSRTQTVGSRDWRVDTRDWGVDTGWFGYEKGAWAGRLVSRPGPGPFPLSKFGGVLLSHNPSVAVPSALSGLASGFGMGPGVSLTL